MNVLEKIRNAKKLKPIEMAKRLEISKSYYSMLSKNERPISKNIALKLKDQFGVQLDVSLRHQVHTEETYGVKLENPAEPDPAA